MIKKQGLLFIVIVGGMISLSASMAYARQNQCSFYLEPQYEFPFEEWPIFKDYFELKQELADTIKEDSVRKVVTLYNTFKDNYHDRYNRYLEGLIIYHPHLEKDHVALRNSLNPLYKMEEKVLNAFKKAILDFPAKKRVHYLRNLTPKKLVKNEILLDALFGINTKVLDQAVRDDISVDGKLDRKKQKSNYGYENIWFGENGEHQTSWRDLISWLENADLTAEQLVVDLGSGNGRLGLLIGVVRPDVEFIGLEIMTPRVQYANDIVRQSGFTNVKFIQANLNTETFKIPEADHFYIYDSTTPDTSENIADQLIKIASAKRFKVYVRHRFDSYVFKRHFDEVDDFGIKVYRHHSLTE